MNSVNLNLITFSTYMILMCGNSGSQPLAKMGGRPPLLYQPIYYFIHVLKLWFCLGIVFLCYLVQMGGEQYTFDQPVYYFILTLKLHFCPR
ncbi:hypothetical protein Hanom_Chr14g01265151 [Helianthus anomalus]